MCGVELHIEMITEDEDQSSSLICGFIALSRERERENILYVWTPRSLTRVNGGARPIGEKRQSQGTFSPDFEIVALSGIDHQGRRTSFWPKEICGWRSQRPWQRAWTKTLVSFMVSVGFGNFLLTLSGWPPLGGIQWRFHRALFVIGYFEINAVIHVTF